jgi:hypothetical protein
MGPERKDKIMSEIEKLNRVDHQPIIERWIETACREDETFGRKPMEMVFSDGETLLVVGASDLLAAIQTDDHGRRVWPSSPNVKSTHRH